MSRLQKLYNLYNRRYFGGKLPPKVKVHFSDKIPGWGRTIRIGKMFQIREKNKIIFQVLPDFEILISTRLKERFWNIAFHQTLLHEMVHVDILTRLKDARIEHGPKFIVEMRKLVDKGAYDPLF